MPRKPPTPCTRCGKPATTKGLCTEHNRRAETQRGTATQRGYDTEHQRMFRQVVLDRAHWLCQQLIDGTPCGAHANIADHHPQTRKQLVAAGANPNDPQYGRALCKHHHDQHTARTQHTQKRA